MPASMEAPIEIEVDRLTASLLAYENGEEETSFWRSWGSVLDTWLWGRSSANVVPANGRVFSLEIPWFCALLRLTVWP